MIYIWCLMRKMYAVILLIPVLTLFAGSVTLASSCAKMACGGMDKAPEKCMIATSHQGCGGRVDGCRQKCHEGQKGKSEQKGKACDASCVDCPLCSLVTFKPFFQWEMARQVTMIDYTVMSDNNLSDYFQQHWKPPNGSFLS
jgi:hypothetical protein